MLKQLEYYLVYYHATIRKTLQLIAVPAIALFSLHAHAEGKDLLAGTSDDLKKTIQESGKFYIYMAEMVMCAVTFVKTRNPLVFAGIIVLSIGFNIIFKIAGVS